MARPKTAARKKNAYAPENAGRARTAKHCPACCEPGQSLPISRFGANRSRPDGREDRCLDCHRDRIGKIRERSRREVEEQEERVIREAKIRATRIASDTEPLRVDDFDYDVGVANDARDKKLSAQASREKKQEFNRHMGENAEALKRAAVLASRGEGTIADNMPGSSGTYVAKLAEQERRFGNRRIARTVSLAQAQEALALQNFKLVADQYLSGRVVPTGLARKPAIQNAKRTVCCLLSDLHFGAELDSLDEPMPFGAVQEARRLEHVMREVIDYKPQHRANSKLCLLVNGDLIEGQLMHQIGAGAPLMEQKAITWEYLSRFIGECSRAFPGVDVHWQNGNHGRDKVRHPGRATWRKWDGHEHEIGYALSKMCSDLRNVKFHLPFRAVSAIDLHGSILGLTHGDTELKIGHPDTAAKNNARELANVNSSRVFDVEFDAWAFGHYHTPRYHPGAIQTIYNGALIPPNGHARASGYIGEAAGQFVWEAVEGFPIGDVRFIHVGRGQDDDVRLGTIIKPFRFKPLY